MFRVKPGLSRVLIGRGGQFVNKISGSGEMNHPTGQRVPTCSFLRCTHSADQGWDCLRSDHSQLQTFKSVGHEQFHTKPWVDTGNGDTSLLMSPIKYHV